LFSKNVKKKAEKVKKRAHEEKDLAISMEAQGPPRPRRILTKNV